MIIFGIIFLVFWVILPLMAHFDLKKIKRKNGTEIFDKDFRWEKRKS